MASEPMSDEQLETFRQTADDARRINTFWSGQYAWTVVRLLAEVERLRAREAALVAVAVGAARLDEERAILCDCRLATPFGHHDGCWVLQAHVIAHTTSDGEMDG